MRLLQTMQKPTATVTGENSSCEPPRTAAGIIYVGPVSIAALVLRLACARTRPETGIY